MTPPPPLDFFGFKCLLLDRLSKALAQLFLVCEPNDTMHSYFVSSKLFSCYVKQIDFTRAGGRSDVVGKNLTSVYCPHDCYDNQIILAVHRPLRVLDDDTHTSRLCKTQRHLFCQPLVQMVHRLRIYWHL